MDKVCRVYLANEASMDGRSASLDLPATDYELLDALDKIQLRKGDLMYWEVEDFYDFGFLAPILNDEASLYDFNALSKRLAVLERHDCIAFEGLVKMETEKQEPFGIPRLIDLAYSTESCHIVSDAHTDEELGRFYAGNGFMPELEALPDAIFEKLNFAKIGKEAREGECGVFVRQGYVMQDEDLDQVYKTLDTTPKKPDYIFRLELTSAYTGEHAILLLPAAQEQLQTALDKLSLDSWDGVELHSFDGALPDLYIDLYHDSIDDLNALAEKVQALDKAGELCRFKAILNANGCHDVGNARVLAEKKGEYVFSPDIRSLSELGMDQLHFSLTDDSVSLLEKHVNLEAYGADILKDENAEITPYGLIQREDGQAMNVKDIASDIEPETEINAMWDMI